jgi:hypothetical protein
VGCVWAEHVQIFFVRGEWGKLLVNVQMEYEIGDKIDEASSLLECDAVSLGEKYIHKDLSELGRF